MKSKIISFIKINKKTAISVMIMLTMAVICIPFLFRTHGGGEDRVYNEFAFIICIFCMLITGILLYLVLFTGLKTEKIFLIAYLTIALVYNFVITPFSPPDELYHRQQADRLTNYILRPGDDVNVYDRSDLMIGIATGHYNSKLAYAAVMNTLFVPDSSEPELISYSPVYTYPVQYFAPSAGLLLGKLLPLSKIMMFYFGRFFNLAFTAAAVFYAIKITPRFKLPMLIIAMLPMFIHQSASYSYDTFINSLSLLLFAMLLRGIFSEAEFGLKSYILIVAAAVLLAPAKYVYSLFILFIFLIPKKNFKNTKDYYIRTISAVALTFASAIAAYLILSLKNPSGGLNWEGYPNYDNAFIISDPLGTVRRFAVTTVSLIDSFVLTCFGSSLSGNTISVNILLIFGFMMLFLLSISHRQPDSLPGVPEAPGVPGRQPDSLPGVPEAPGGPGRQPDSLPGVPEAPGGPFNNKLRLMSVFVIIAIYLGVLYSMFTGWTSNHHLIIQGVQGRYFIPLLLPFAFACSNRFITYKLNNEGIIVLIAAILNIFVIYDVLYKTIIG